MSKSLSLFVYAFCVCISNLNAQDLSSNIEKSTSPNLSINSGSVLTYSILQVENNTFGYDIYSDGRKKIHQTSIPCLPGHEGFTTRASAEKVALLVISKIKKGESPPSITIEEMKSLKAIP